MIIKALGFLEVRKCQSRDYVINGSGPEMSIEKHPSELVQNLLRNKIVVPNPLHMGIQVDEEYRIVGNEALPLFAVGQILLGERLETTAVPELREQCAQAAEAMLEMA